MAQERQPLSPFNNYEEWYWDRFRHEPTQQEVERWEGVLARDEGRVDLTAFPRSEREFNPDFFEPLY